MNKSNYKLLALIIGFVVLILNALGLLIQTKEYSIDRKEAIVYDTSGIQEK